MNDADRDFAANATLGLRYGAGANRLPWIRVPREVVEECQGDLVRQLMDRMTQQALDKVRAEEVAVLRAYSQGQVEEAAESLGLEKVTMPCKVEPWVHNITWEACVGKAEEPPAPLPPPPAPEVADRWDYVGPETKVLDYTDGYMKTVHQPDELFELASEELAEVEYDTLVGTGLSGTIAVTDLARRLGKNYLIVRKPNDSIHSSLPEGRLGQRWVFVDDLIATGTTWARVYDAVLDLKNDRGFNTEYVGCLLYTYDRRDPGFYDRDESDHDKWFKLSKYHPDNQDTGVAW